MQGEQSPRKSKTFSFSIGLRFFFSLSKPRFKRGNEEMNDATFNYWVQYVRKKYIPIPDALIKNLSDVSSRSLIARALIRVGQCAPAIELLKTIADEPVNIKKPDEFALSNVEDQAWCLWELAKLIWLTEANAASSLCYLERAIQLSDDYPYKFYFIVRGEVWYDKLIIQKQSGNVLAALQEVKDLIKRNRFASEKSDSHMFYAYRFRAELAADKNNWKGVLENLHRAASFYPFNFDAQQQFKRLWSERMKNPVATVQKNASPDAG